MIEHPAGVSSATTDATVRAWRFHHDPTTTRLADDGFLLSVSHEPSPLIRPSRPVQARPMKPFDSLTRLGAARRLQPLVENAGRHYDLRVERVRLLSTARATATPPNRGGDLLPRLAVAVTTRAPRLRAACFPIFAICPASGQKSARLLAVVTALQGVLDPTE